MLDLVRKLVGVPIARPSGATAAALLVAAFCFLTMAAILVPLDPLMPSLGPDQPWVLGINQAVADGMRFGHDVIFTYGPWAAVRTKAYHPQLDHLVLIGSLFLTVSFTIAIVRVSGGRSSLFILGVLLFLASGGAQRDALLLWYPLLATLAILYERPTRAPSHEHPSRTGLLGRALLVAPLGLLPLIKGSFLLSSTVAVICLIVVLAARRDYVGSVIAVVVPGVALLLFWTLSGQQIADLLPYIHGLREIIAGFGDAMALAGSPARIWEPLVFLTGGLVLALAVVTTGHERLLDRSILLLSLTLFLFISFKAGFIRHDGHVLIAASSLVLAAITVLLLRGPTQSAVIAVVVALALWLPVNLTFRGSADSLVRQVYWTYVSAGEGLAARVFEPRALQGRFAQSIEHIRSSAGLPEVDGSTDLYPEDLYFLFGSSNVWNPRPIMHSYSAYTPWLAQTNAEHLIGSSAPDNIFFKVAPIDGRFPALDDGPSWPYLLSNYRVRDARAGYLLLRRRSDAPKEFAFDWYAERAATLDQWVDVPVSSAPLFARVQVTPTLAGRLWSAMYKAPQLTLTVRLTGGEEQSFRVVAGMLAAGFVLTPLVSTTDEFAALMVEEARLLETNRVTGFRISSAYGGGWLWASRYTVSTARFRRPDG